MSVLAVHAQNIFIDTGALDQNSYRTHSFKRGWNLRMVYEH